MSLANTPIASCIFTLTKSMSMAALSKWEDLLLVQALDTPSKQQFPLKKFCIDKE
jgi:hypothetical protein